MKKIIGYVGVIALSVFMFTNVSIDNKDSDLENTNLASLMTTTTANAENNGGSSGGGGGSSYGYYDQICYLPTGGTSCMCVFIGNDCTYYIYCQ